MNHQLNKLVDAYNKGAAKATALSGCGVGGLNPTNTAAELEQSLCANYREQSVFDRLEKIEMLFEAFDNTVEHLEKSLAPVLLPSATVPSPAATTAPPMSSVPMVQRLTNIHEKLCALGRRLEDIHARVFIM